jgi:hypothetical protein
MGEKISNGRRSALSAIAKERRRAKNGQPVAPGFEQNRRDEAVSVNLAAEPATVNPVSDVRRAMNHSERMAAEAQARFDAVKPSARAKKLRVFTIRSRNFLKRNEMASGYTMAQIASLLRVSPSTLSIDGAEQFSGEKFDSAVAQPGVVFWANQGGSPDDQKFVTSDEFVQRVPKL